MATRKGITAAAVETPPRHAGRPPSRRPPARRPPRRTSSPRRTSPPRSFRRWLFRPSAPRAIVMTLLLAVVVAFVATLVYATVDAGRPLEGGPTTAERAEGDVAPGTIGSEVRPTTTRPPELLTPEQLSAKVAPAVRSVRTRDEAGQPVEGSAFVVGSFGGQTMLLTSLEVVRASTRAPAPVITLGESQQATLWTWEESRDLALLIVGGVIESLPWADPDEPVQAGERVFAGRGGTLSVGTILAASNTAIENTIFVEDPLRGAPIVNQKGQVVAMVSRAYNPSGRGTETQFTGVPVRLSCERVIRCGAGNTGGGSTTATTRP